MGSAASIVRAPIHGASVDEVTKIFEELHEPDRKKLLSAMAASQSQRARYGGEYLIHWDTTRGFEGKFSGDEFVAHDGDRRAVLKSEIYKLGEEWKCFEGKFSGDEFVAHDGDRRAVSKSEIYKLGEEWKCDDRVWAYWTKDNKYLNSGKVTAVGAEKSYVEFDDKDKGPIPNGWIHKMVKHETDNGNESNLSNNNS
ncbi:unnamed protein product [Durusdinium trenchii]|uniref:Uncharacterized protein n=1 Tax=Durusdinium trenchii TaxID=1381693 RepID=A0ABP0JP04_9DINO